MQAKNLFSIFMLILMALPALARAEYRGDWTRLDRDSVSPPYSPQGDKVCIGGDRCRGHYGNTLELPLGRRPIEAVRFYAHDNVGNKHRGKVRVSIDGYEIAGYVDVKRDGAVHTIDAHGQRGRYLTFTALRNDEVVIAEVEVLYGRRQSSYEDPGYGRPSHHRPSHHRPKPAHYATDWRTVKDARGCFGGEICGHYGYELPVYLTGAPIYGVRFFAHDAVGNKTGGRLRVSLDGRVLEYDLDVKRSGGIYEIALDGVRGRHLTFQALGNDEVVVEKVKVLYGSGYRR